MSANANTSSSTSSQATPRSFLRMKVGWVFVGNLAPAVTESKLERYFEAVAGPVKEVSIRYCGIPDITTGHPDGPYRYAMVHFDGTAEEAAACAELALDQDGIALPGPRYQGFPIVVVDEPAGLPEVARVAETQGIPSDTVLSGLKKHTVTRHNGVHTAAGHKAVFPA
ncbi:hypothetical protein C8F01DRAFT_750411 [Mycena amicta]|nr:hypothetical protein C8F01DRAFT_750411 [Mycena amicta]